MITINYINKNIKLNKNNYDFFIHKIKNEWNLDTNDFFAHSCGVPVNKENFNNIFNNGNDIIINKKLNGGVSTTAEIIIWVVWAILTILFIMNMVLGFGNIGIDLSLFSIKAIITDIVEPMVKKIFGIFKIIPNILKQKFKKADGSVPFLVKIIDWIVNIYFFLLTFIFGLIILVIHVVVKLGTPVIILALTYLMLFVPWLMVTRNYCESHKKSWAISLISTGVYAFIYFVLNSPALIAKVLRSVENVFGDISFIDAMLTPMITGLEDTSLESIIETASIPLSIVGIGIYYEIVQVIIFGISQILNIFSTGKYAMNKVLEYDPSIGGQLIAVAQVLEKLAKPELQDVGLDKLVAHVIKLLKPLKKPDNNAKFGKIMNYYIDFYTKDFVFDIFFGSIKGMETISYFWTKLGNDIEKIGLVVFGSLASFSWLITTIVVTIIMVVMSLF